MECRLVTWNLHGLPPPVRSGAAVRIRRAADEVCRRNPDVALFQEVWLESLAEDIVGHCKPAGYAPVMSGQGGRSTGGLVMLCRTSKWSVSKTAFTPFESHASALRVWEGDGIARKGVLAAVLTGVNSASGTFTVANTHLQAQYGSERYAEVRAAQVKELDAAIGNVGPGPRDRPIVLAGDFNTRPDDPLYSKIGQQWIDLTAGYRKRCERVAREACGTSFSGQLPSEWIDYVLLRQMDGLTAAAVVELIRNKREDDPFSDHEGLQADISITRSPAAASGLLGRLVHQVGDPRPLTRRNSLDILLGLSERRFPI